MYIINLSYYVTNLLYLSKLIQIYYNVGPNTFNENETIAKYEIMDGAPVRGESIPIRVFLAGYDLTPTMRDVNKRFSVRYFLNLVLMDEEDRRYFKQQVSYNFTINYFFSMYCVKKHFPKSNNLGYRWKISSTFRGIGIYH